MRAGLTWLPRCLEILNVDYLFFFPCVLILCFSGIDGVCVVQGSCLLLFLECKRAGKLQRSFLGLPFCPSRLAPSFVGPRVFHYVCSCDVFCRRAILRGITRALFGIPIPSAFLLFFSFSNYLSTGSWLFLWVCVQACWVPPREVRSTAFGPTISKAEGWAFRFVEQQRGHQVF